MKRNGNVCQTGRRPVLAEQSNRLQSMNSQSIPKAQKLACRAKDCFVCPDVTDVMHALIGADMKSLNLQELSTFLDFEMKFRETFGQEALFVVESDLVRIGRNGARHFVRALLNQFTPPESVEVALALAALNAAREKHIDHVQSGEASPVRVGMTTSTRDRVSSLIDAWKEQVEVPRG